MPKRTRDHQSWLIEKLSDAGRAASYLTSALEDSPEMFLEALRDVAQAQQMAKTARKAGVTRESLYKLTSVTGNPTLGSLYSVLKALDLKIEIRGKHASHRSLTSLSRSGRARASAATARRTATPTITNGGRNAIPNEMPTHQQQSIFGLTLSLPDAVPEPYVIAAIQERKGYINVS